MAEAQSGLAAMRGQIGVWARSPLGQLMGHRLIAVEDGMALFEATPSDEHYNPRGIVHGGYFAALLDSAMGCAVETKFPAGHLYGTIELKVNFIRPMTARTGRILCRGTVIHAGRRMQTAEARLEDGAGKLYGHGSGTFMTMGSGPGE